MSAHSCVIYNPTAGRGKASKQIDAARRRFGSGYEYWPTASPGHAAELATKAAKVGYPRVIAAGGDGTVHDVANGLLNAGHDRTILSIWPFGSMNDLAYSLGLLRWWTEGATRPINVIRQDVGVVHAAGRSQYFVNGCGVGFNSMVALESHSIRSVRGTLLYVLAYLRSALRHFAAMSTVVRLGPIDLNGPTLSLSVNLGQREGGFRLTPDARLDDGLFDVLHIGAIRRWELLRYLPGLIAGRLPETHPLLRRFRCDRLTIQGGSSLCVHTDGELFAVPSDETNVIHIELLPRRLPMEVCPEYYCQSDLQGN